jgi:hypothetical protein
LLERPSKGGPALGRSNLVEGLAGHDLLKPLPILRGEFIMNLHMRFISKEPEHLCDPQTSIRLRP